MIKANYKFCLKVISNCLKLMATRLSSQSQLFFIRMVIREIKMVVKISNYNYNQNMIDVFNCIWIVKNVFVTKVLYSFVQIICNLNLYCSSVQSFKYRRPSLYAVFLPAILCICDTEISFFLEPIL